MLQLDPRSLHLYFLFVEEIYDSQLIQSCRQLLTDDERARELRFRFLRDRQCYLLSRALVRTALSRHAPIAPGDWAFDTTAYGRPRIINDDPKARRMSFNLSHTQGLVMLGITLDRALGVDTENIKTRHALPTLARHFFSPAEADSLDTLASEQQQERFYHYWTLKESYIKARGLGLSIPLDKFAFHFPVPGRLSLRIDPQLNDHSSRWHFWQLRPSADHLAAVCVSKSTELRPKLVMHRVLGLCHTESVDYPPLRTSA